MPSSSYDETFAIPAARTLLESGQLDTGWVSSLTTTVLHAQTEPALTWRAGHFRLLRFVSMYLPIRYLTWRRGSGQTIPKTEEVLAELGRLAEAKLWREALAMGSHPGAATLDDARLANLVFDSVEGLCSGEISLSKWETEYRHSLDLMSPRWRIATEWPRWTCMAIHFASFYLDIGLTRYFEPVDRMHLSTEHIEVLHRLEHLAGNTTANIVAAWLAHATAQRDGTGTLLCGQAKNGTRKTIVRGVSEIMVMAHMSDEGR